MSEDNYRILTTRISDRWNEVYAEHVKRVDNARDTFFTMFSAMQKLYSVEEVCDMFHNTVEPYYEDEVERSLDNLDIIFDQLVSMCATAGINVERSIDDDTAKEVLLFSHMTDDDDTFDAVLGDMATTIVEYQQVTSKYVAELNAKDNIIKHLQQQIQQNENNGEDTK